MAAGYEYDEQGDTTVIFSLVFVTFYLLIATILRLYKLRQKEGCVVDKLPKDFVTLCNKKCVPRPKEKKGWFNIWNIIYLMGWIIFILLVVRIKATDVMPLEEYNPYQILGISEGADPKEIKSAYRKRSREMHPDKNPDDPLANEKYMKIVQAHQTLTDPDTRANWEMYGHPDGRRAQSFGVALPAWLVSNDYKWIIFTLYCLSLIGGIFGVYFWWRSSSQMSEIQVRHDTLAVFYQLMRPKMTANEVIEVLCAAPEFNLDIPERDIDAKMIPEYISAIKAKDSAFVRFVVPTKENAPYWLKAKALVFSYMLGLEGNLDVRHKEDLNKMLITMPILVSAFLKMAMAKASQSMRQKGGVFYSFEPVLHACYAIQLLTQGREDIRLFPVKQIPHINDENFKYFTKGKRNVATIEQLVDMPEEDRRSMLRMLNDDDYNELMLVANQIPRLKVKSTVKVTIERTNGNEVKEKSLDNKMEDNDVTTKVVAKGNLRKRQLNHKKEEATVEALSLPSPSPSKPLSKGYEDVEWDDSLIKEEKIFKDQPHSVPVYCPRWLLDKEEGWWVFATPNDIVEGSPHGMLLCEPKKIENLVDSIQVDLLIPPVPTAGKHSIAIWVVSDSYVGCETRTLLEFIALPAPDLASYEISDSEGEGTGENNYDRNSEDESDVESDSDLDS